MRSLLLIALLAAPIAQANPKVRMSIAASDAISTTYSCEEITGVTGTDSTAKVLPSQFYALRLEGTLTSVVTAASGLWFLAKDSGGDKPITDIVTETITDHDADNSGAVITTVNAGYALDDDSTPQSLWVCASTDAGTATMVTRLFWEAR